MGFLQVEYIHAGNVGSGFFYIEGLGEWNNNFHLGYWVIVSEGALKSNIFKAICEIIKNGDLYLELIN